MTFVHSIRFIWLSHRFHFFVDALHIGIWPHLMDPDILSSPFHQWTISLFFVSDGPIQNTDAFCIYKTILGEAKRLNKKFSGRTVWKANKINAARCSSEFRRYSWCCMDPYNYQDDHRRIVFCSRKVYIHGCYDNQIPIDFHTNFASVMWSLVHL